MWPQAVAAYMDRRSLASSAPFGPYCLNGIDFHSTDPSYYMSSSLSSSSSSDPQDQVPSSPRLPVGPLGLRELPAALPLSMWSSTPDAASSAASPNGLCSPQRRDVESSWCLTRGSRVDADQSSPPTSASPSSDCTTATIGPLFSASSRVLASLFPSLPSHTPKGQPSLTPNVPLSAWWNTRPLQPGMQPMDPSTVDSLSAKDVLKKESSFLDTIQTSREERLPTTAYWQEGSDGSSNGQTSQSDSWGSGSGTQSGSGSGSGSGWWWWWWWWYFWCLQRRNEESLTRAQPPDNLCVDTSLESGSTRCSRDRVPTPATVLTKSSLSDSAPSVHDWRNDQLSGRYGDKFSPSLRLADRMDVGTSAGRSVGAAPPMPAHLPPPAQTSIAAVWPPTTQECGDADALQGAEGSRHLLLGQTRADVDPATGSGSALTFYQALMTQHLQTLLKPEFAALHSQTNTTVASAHSGHFHLQPMPSVENMYHQNPTTGYTAVPPYYGAAVLSPRRRQTNGEPASCHDTGVPEATSTPVAEWRRPPTSSASQTCRNSTIPKMTDICLSSSPCSASSSSSSSSSSSPSSSSASSSTALTPPPRQLLGPCHSNSLLSTSGNITLVPGSSTNTLTTSKNSRLACATPATPRSDCWADLEVNLGQNTDADAANVAKEMVKSAGIIPGSHSNGVCRKVCDKVGISSLTGELATCAVGHFTCRVCAKAYTQASALKMHIRTHTLPCRCERCGKSFSRKWLLKGHERTHTGERPYHCQLCSRSFADRSNLRAHMQTHQRDKRYRCPTCPRSFSRMGLLNKHLSHTHRHMPTGQHMIPGLSLTLVSSKSTI